MKYLKLYEELYLAKSVEIYANLVMSNLSEIGTNFPKKFIIHVQNPETDFPIRAIKIIKTDSDTLYNSKYSSLDSIYIEINPLNIKYSTLIHELTHAYQDFKIKSKGKKMNGFLGQFVSSVKSISNNQDYQFLLMGLYFSTPTEISAHIAQYNYSTISKLEKWIKWYKTFSPENTKPTLLSIESIEDIFPNLFVDKYKEYCSNSNIEPKKSILNLENKDISFFLQWCKKLFDKIAPNIERKMLRIKSNRTTS